MDRNSIQFDSIRFIRSDPCSVGLEATVLFLFFSILRSCKRSFFAPILMSFISISSTSFKFQSCSGEPIRCKSIVWGTKPHLSRKLLDFQAFVATVPTTWALLGTKANHPGIEPVTSVSIIPDLTMLVIVCGVTE